MVQATVRLFNRSLFRSSGRGRFFSHRLPLSALLGGGDATWMHRRRQDEEQRPVYHQQQQQTRHYRATPRQEILPIIGAAAVLLVARYSYRALNRMEEEWEEYQWQLQQYERKHGQGSTDGAAVHSIQTLAIDLGTVYSKIASSHVGLKDPKHAEVIVSREGDRYFFNGVVVEGDDNAVLGRKALEKFFFPQGEAVTEVKLPWAGLLTAAPDTNTLVSKVISPVLQETLERLESKEEATRFVVTVPSLLVHTNGFQSAFQSLSSKQTTFVPDPVAAVWGAQTKGFIPMDDEGKANKVLVVDIGGYLTQLSIVQKDKMQSSLVFPWGGETLVEKAVQVIREQSPEPIADERSLSATQVQARDAVAALTTQMQVPVHVHYIFATPGKHHLDTTLSRSVLEQAVQSEIQELASTDDMGSLSKHMPTPTNLEMLFVSMVTELLERNNAIPQAVDKILLVGGASRFPLVRKSLMQAMSLLMPSEEANGKLVHDVSFAPELVVLGAANILPAYTYDVSRGLVRSEQN